jgi:hypothetical protein
MKNNFRQEGHATAIEAGNAVGLGIVDFDPPAWAELFQGNLAPGLAGKALFDRGVLALQYMVLL